MGKFEATKLSVAAFFRVIDNYVLLNSGAALGRGCGPILVKKKGSHANLHDNEILIPGELTTANLLLKLHLKNSYTTRYARYDKIITDILEGKADFGIIIHEERFTFEQRGLEPVVDLGEFWEGETGLPIPLGAIAVKRELPQELQKELQASIKESIVKAEQINPYSYILQHSQNKDPDIVKKHIDLYVNAFSKDLGEEGTRAVTELYNRAVSAGFVTKNDFRVFV